MTWYKFRFLNFQHIKNKSHETKSKSDTKNCLYLFQNTMRSLVFTVALVVSLGLVNGKKILIKK